MRVGFIGLGFQGKPLARNIIEGGHVLSVFDVREEPMRELAQAGAKPAASPAAVAATSDVVIVCVVDDAQVLDVLDGDQGILAGSRDGLIVVIHSTILPDTVARAAELAAARGAVLIDCPVSGSAKGAEERTMSFMAGGPKDAIATCLPLFRLSGSTITLTGGIGTATKAKIAHQLVCCVNMMAAYEGLRLGEAAGVSREVLIEVFNSGFAQSRAIDMWPELDLHPRATPIFYKDLRAALTLGHDVDVALPAAALTQQRLAEILPRIDKRA